VTTKQQRPRWGVPLPELTVEIAGKYPSLNAAAITAAVERYAAFRDDSYLPPSKAAKRCQTLINRLDEISVTLATLPFEIIEPFNELTARSKIRDGILNDTRIAVDHLAGALELVRRQIVDAPKIEGAGTGKGRGLLIRDIARILSGSNLPSDCKPTGPLCTVMGMVFRQTGEGVTRIPVVVENALKGGD
jgi:hypothetical protein